MKHFVFPKHGVDGDRYFAIESNPATRAMYATHGIAAAPYERFILNPTQYLGEGTE